MTRLEDALERIIDLAEQNTLSADYCDGDSELETERAEQLRDIEIVKRLHIEMCNGQTLNLSPLSIDRILGEAT